MTAIELAAWHALWSPERLRFDEYESNGNRPPLLGWMDEQIEDADD